MKKIVEWINRHKKLSVILFSIVIFVPIVVIHILFKIKTNCYWIAAEWEPGDVLGYFGDVLSFVGTVVLGYVAICQTEKSNELSNKLLELEWRQMQPCLCLDGNQEYKIYIGAEEIEEVEKEYGIKDMKIKSYYINKNNRTGITTPIAVMVVTIQNTGGSDIRNISIQSNYCYLSAIMPDGYNECVVHGIEGDTSIKKGESKKLFIEFVQELDVKMENFELDKAKAWVGSDKLMIPAFDFDIQLITVDGFNYKENLVCSTFISDIEYEEEKIKNVKNVKNVKRYLSVTDMSIERCE